MDGGLRTRGNMKTFISGRPHVTVITVVFNGAAHLEQAITSGGDHP
jgi:hypothetical protein